jgi:hypothetical protein
LKFRKCNYDLNTYNPIYQYDLCALEKFISISVLQLSHMYNEKEDSTDFMEFLPLFLSVLRIETKASCFKCSTTWAVFPPFLTLPGLISNSWPSYVHFPSTWNKDICHLQAPGGFWQIKFFSLFLFASSSLLNIPGKI